MKPSALFEALHALIGQRVPLHIWGACGVGKSQIVCALGDEDRVATLVFAVLFMVALLSLVLAFPR
jgi:hypothetical protein